MKERATQTRTAEARREKSASTPQPAPSARAPIHLALQLQRAIGNQAVQDFVQRPIIEPGAYGLGTSAFIRAQQIWQQRAADTGLIAEVPHMPQETGGRLGAERVQQEKMWSDHISLSSIQATLAVSQLGGGPKPAPDHNKTPTPLAWKQSESLLSVDKATPKESAAEAAAVEKEILRAPATPSEDPAFREAKNQVRTEAKKQKEHALNNQKRKEAANRKRKEAENASAMDPPVQADQSSKEKDTEQMAAKAGEQVAKPQDERQAFKNKLKDLIKGKRPKTESNAKALAQNPPIKQFEENFSENVALEQGKVAEPLGKAVDPQHPRPTGVVEKTPVPVPNPIHPPAPKPVDPKLTTPKPRTDDAISLQHESDRLDGAMRANRLSDDQLAESREPSFLQTLKIKQEAQQKLAEAPGVYREQESGLLRDAQVQANASLSTKLGGMTQIALKTGGHICDGQKEITKKTIDRQLEIKGIIDGIYKTTSDAVRDILNAMATAVKADFANSLKKQTEIFNQQVTSGLEHYYTTGRKIWHFLTGEPRVMVNDDEDGTTRELTPEERLAWVHGKEIPGINPAAYEIFKKARGEFLDAIDHEIDRIAGTVQAWLDLAKFVLKLGRGAIADYKKTLKGDERTFAEGLEEGVEERFKNLEGSIDDAREDLLQTLADQYTENVNQLEKTFNEINDELRKTWVDRAVDFIETVGKTISQLAELLLSILSRMANIIWDIIKHPIRFFETLVSGLMQGIGMFIENIGTYMQEAFWTWITGASPEKNIRLSASSGIASLFDLVLQVLNLGPADLRAIVEKVLGKEFMQMIDQGIALGEKALEPVIILFTKGPVALWDYIEDSLGSIIRSSFDRIKESVFNSLIEKGLKWIAGFFIPGGGFVKVVKAIFRAFQFVVENLENIRHFFDSIFDSMEAAIEGHTEGVASKVITGLKAGMVLALDFLAKQLGLTNLIESVHKIIQSLRKPIVSAIEWVLGKVKPFVAKIARGVTRVAGAIVSKLVDWTGLRRVFRTRGGDSHSLFTRVINRRPTLMLATQEQTFADYLAALIIPKEDVEKTAAKQKAVTTFATINTKLAELAAMEARFGPNPVSAQRGQLNAKLDEIRCEFHVLSDQVTVLGIAGSRAETVKTHIAPTSGSKLTHLEAKPLTPLRGNTVGNPNPQAEKNVPGWQFLDEINLARNNDKLVYNEWVRWHLIHSSMHGPAAAFNLVTAPRGVNTRFTNAVEQPLLKLLAQPGAMFYYKVDVTYGNPAPPLNDFPTSIKYSWGTMKMDPADRPVEVGPAPGSPATYSDFKLPAMPGAAPTGPTVIKLKTLGRGPLTDKNGLGIATHPAIRIARATTAYQSLGVYAAMDTYYALPTSLYTGEPFARFLDQDKAAIADAVRRTEGRFIVDLT